MRTLLMKCDFSRNHWKKRITRMSKGFRCLLKTIKRSMKNQMSRRASIIQEYIERKLQKITHYRKNYLIRMLTQLMILRVLNLPARKVLLILNLTCQMNWKLSLVLTIKNPPKILVVVRMSIRASLILASRLQGWKRKSRLSSKNYNKHPYPRSLWSHLAKT